MLLNKHAGDLTALGAVIISTVISTFNLDPADQDFVNMEIEWLFSAADNLQKICRKEIAPGDPIVISIPPTAHKTLPEANNHLPKNPRVLTRYMSYDDMLWNRTFNLGREIESKVNRLNTYLRGFNTLLDREAKMGEAGKSDIMLQNQIREGRIGIVKVLQEMAQLMDEVYGIKVTSPDQLIEFLG